MLPQEHCLESSVEAARALISPRSVAIIGASPRSRWATAILANLDRHGFPGSVHLVNPRGGTIGARRVATSCAAIGEQVDLGVVIVPAEATVQATIELADVGARSATVLTSGFAEVGAEGARLQADLLAAASTAGIRVLGPNSLGFMNFVDHAIGWATPIDVPAHTEGVALISQSGATALFLADLAHRQGIPMSHVVATGNEADLDSSTFATAVVEHERTRAVAMFIESVRNPEAFLVAARGARAAGKPLVVCKVGTSEITARSALAHTGALVGDDRVFNGICEQYGIVRVRSLEELMSTADIIGRTGVLPRDGLLVVSNSGGICEIAADTSDALGVDLPELPSEVRTTVRDAMPGFGTPHNPLDLTGAVMPAEVETVLTAATATHRYGAVLVPYYSVPSSRDIDDQRLSDLHRHIAGGLARSPVPGFLTTYTPDGINAVAQETIDDLGLPYLACGMDRAISGLAKAFWWSALQRERSGEPELHADAGLDVRPDSEVETMRLLMQCGVPVVPQLLVTDAESAFAAASSWSDRSVLKIASPDIIHKTEIGGVALDVADTDVPTTFERLLAIAHAQPSAVVEGVIVSPMRRGGTELFVGCSFDPTWGPVVAVGGGGIWVELLADVAIRPLPVDVPEVRRMLSGLRISSLLRGARGQVPADLDAVARAVVAIGQVALRLGPDLAALDVNPLWVRGEQVEAMDALAVWH